MRRTLFLALVLLTAFAVAVPVADAQTPNPNTKFTISGLIDNVGTYTRNMSAYDFNLARNNDAQMYGRTRGRFDIIGQIGKAKAVLGIEIDEYWGQTGFGDSNAAGCIAAATGAVACGTQGSGAESSFDIGTDTQANLQIKWLYTEFPVPLVPVPTVMRLGGQPFGAAANYKLATYANGDFGGVNIVSQITPGFKLLFTYVAVEELLTGKKDIANTAGLGAIASQPQSRGDDLAFIVSAEFSPFKGLDIKPMYSYFFANGVTSGASRQGRGGLSIAPAVTANGTTAGNPFSPKAAWGADGVGTGLEENRNTVGVDARWASGPFSVAPTVMYQWGTRQAVNTTSAAYGTTCSGAAPTTCPRYTAKESAWLVDIRAGFQFGAFLFQGMYMWTSGDPAENNPYKHIGYFQPLSTDTSYMADWGTQITSLGVDYYQILNGGAAQAGLNPGVAIGYDKYGRHMFGLRANYAWTPALNTYFLVTPQWTDRSVDSDGIAVANGGIQPNFICRKTSISCRPDGDSNYIGTELDAGLTWKFADGLTLDWAVGWLLAGGALAHRHPGVTYCDTGVSNASCQPQNGKDQKANDVIITTARVRYVF